MVLMDCSVVLPDKKMKYIIIGDCVREYYDLLYDIADVFWDAGGEVYIRDKDSKIDYREIAEDYHCLVLLISDICLEECLFSEVEKIHKGLKVDVIQGGQPVLIFSQRGVYSNAIPYPHKLFHFEKLVRHEVARFSHWRKIISVS
jgi:hypothetical protein